MRFGFRLTPSAFNQFDIDDLPSFDARLGLEDPAMAASGSSVRRGEPSSQTGAVAGQTVLYAPDGGSGSASGAGGSGSGSSTTVVTSAASSSSPFVINITWDASVQSAPS